MAGYSANYGFYNMYLETVLCFSLVFCRLKNYFFENQTFSRENPARTQRKMFIIFKFKLYRNIFLSYVIVLYSTDEFKNV